MITNFIFIRVVYFFYPEISNLRLEDIDLIFFRGGDAVKQARLMAAEIEAHGYIHSEPMGDEKDLDNDSIKVEHVQVSGHFRRYNVYGSVHLLYTSLHRL